MVVGSGGGEERDGQVAARLEPHSCREIWGSSFSSVGKIAGIEQLDFLILVIY